MVSWAVVAEWLRRLTRNQISYWSVGSNPTGCDFPHHILRQEQSLEAAQDILGFLIFKQNCKILYYATLIKQFLGGSSATSFLNYWMEAALRRVTPDLQGLMSRETHAFFYDTVKAILHVLHTNPKANSKPKLVFKQTLGFGEIGSNDLLNG